MSGKPSFALRQAFRFFHRQSGAIGTRALDAYSLANAELEYSRRDWNCIWGDDIDVYSLCKDFDGAENVERWESACIEDEFGRVLAHCGGIADADSDYQRFMRAELMLEAMQAYTPEGPERMLIADFKDGWILAADSQDVAEIKAKFPGAEDYDSFFVRVGEGEYTHVYGYEGFMANSYKTAYRVFPVVDAPDKTEILEGLLDEEEILA